MAAAAPGRRGGGGGGGGAMEESKREENRSWLRAVTAVGTVTVRAGVKEIERGKQRQRQGAHLLPFLSFPFLSFLYFFLCQILFSFHPSFPSPLFIPSFLLRKKIFIYLFIYLVVL
jgi:hypothetical protein